MAARAMWKGVIRFEGVRVPVKLYAAVEDRSVHFRLLHRKDLAPVRQAMVDPESGEEVPAESIRRAFVTGDAELVVLRDEDLERTRPEASRDIQVLQFLPPESIDHRWYQRPYYLGPDDGAEEAYAALTVALGESGREGLARWVMRNREYRGALRIERARLMLVSLRHTEEIVSAEELTPPEGGELAKRELDMARQLMDMLAGPFDPAQYRDTYRARVEELIAAKARGGHAPKKRAPRRRPAADLTAALEASLKQERKRA